jgi:4-coumarate--CoA ligase
LEHILEVSSRPCLTDGKTGFAYFYIEVNSLSWHCAAGLDVGKGNVIKALLHNCPDFGCVFPGAAQLSCGNSS